MALIQSLRRGAFSILDRLTPKTNLVAIRTFPDYDEQAAVLVEALTRNADCPPLVWLVDSLRGVATPRVRVVPAQSIRGLWAFLRARAVVHTHGVFNGYRPSRRKVFLNLWHGMPIKRLEANSRVGRYQTTVSIATSRVHAEHLSATWGIPIDRIRVTGLPRNDKLLKPTPPALPVEVRRIPRRPLIVWLPTYRKSMVGDIRSDGTDFGNVFQFPGATPEAVEQMMVSIGAEMLVKPHPMAPQPECSSLGNLTIRSSADLDKAGVTLYEVLRAADVLVTDYSSVWVDFLLRGKPIVFAIGDLNAYEHSRGFYFNPIRKFLPGPVVNDLRELQEALGEALSAPDAYEPMRSEALELHHKWRDPGSGDRVADLLLTLLQLTH